MSIFRRAHDKLIPSDTPSIPIRVDSVTSFRPSPLSIEYTSSTAYSTSDTGPQESFVDGSRSSLLGRFSSRTVRDKDGEEGIKGPVGLRLLHSSPEPLIDLIFVHGLRGGSVKTWRKGNDAGFFWPQHWLPMEEGFHNANVHSFGYESDWASTKSSILNVHDFGQTLLEEMRNSPSMRGHVNRPIIMIGHSMGGLVIKKAYILAHGLPEWESRIKCIFFLATPHRGSDYAALLNNILTASGFLHPRHYITDLTTGNTSTVLINDDFAKCASDLTIYSFYETLGMNIGGLASRTIVERTSAVLGAGFKNERVQYINANHRNIVKYDGIDDPGYLSVKNALSGAIHDLLADVTYVKKEESSKQLESLRTFLGIPDHPMEHHGNAKGTCAWINNRKDFIQWRDDAQESDVAPDKQPDKQPRKNTNLFWVHANPGTGKTTLSAYVTSQLREYKLECACHYFHVSNKSSRSVSYFLRSIAYQMACTNSAIRDVLSKSQEEGASFDMDDAQTIWSKCFRKGIFQTRIYSPQYWVIDAIDECSRYSELFTLLRSDFPNFPLKIFLTSRNIPDMQRISKQLEAAVSNTIIPIPEQDSLQDIEQYIAGRIDDLPVDTDSDKLALARKILDKSNAIFLWVRLVMDNLQNVYSHESILNVLDSIPNELVPYYERSTKALAENNIEKHISKALFMWVVSSGRPMTMTEIVQALQLDINTTLPSTRAAFESLCGQLVAVDSSTGIVGVIHPTAREFLLTEAAGEFMVSRSKANERLALACLKFLNSSELRPPRGRKTSTEDITKDPSPFLHYAATQFSEHINGASAESDELLLAIDRFLKTNVLTWIERIARRGVLYHLINVSKNLRGYLDRGAKFRVKMSSQVKNIDDWASDLTRLVTHYARALIEDPGAIYNLIAPLCPHGSAIYRQFGRRPGGLGVVGYKGRAWDDCVASVSFGEDSASAIHCNANSIAVALESGDIVLYNHQTCQKELILHHRDFIELVHLTDDFVVICTVMAVVLQDLDGSVKWQHKLRYKAIHLSVRSQKVVVVTQHGHWLSWDVTSGDLLKDQAFVYHNDASTDMENAFNGRAPFLASISPEDDVLAMAYRGGAICLYDTESAEQLGLARSDHGMAASQLLFNPNPNINYLLVIHTNHDLSLFDTWSGSLMLSHKTRSDIGVISATTSPDGRTLATVDTLGHFQIWDFETLTLMHHVFSPSSGYRELKFTSDGFTIVDITAASMRVWEPAALVRRHIEDDSSGSINTAQPSVAEGQYETLRKTRITVLCAHATLPLVFAGKYDGTVVAFDADNGKQVEELYSHGSTRSILKMAINKDNVIATADISGNVQVWQLSASKSVIKGKSLIFRARTPSHMKQLCFSGQGTYLLVASQTSDDLYLSNSGALIGKLPATGRISNNWKWFFWPGPDEQMALLNQHVLQRYSCTTFPAVLQDSKITLDYDAGEGNIEGSIDTCVVDQRTQTLILDVFFTRSYTSSSCMILFDLAKITSAMTLAPLSSTIPKYCRNFIGISPSTQSLVFLHKSSWLSSIDLDSLRLNRYTQHFFVPNDYIETSTHVRVPVKTANDDIVFCLHGELVIVKNGLRFEEDRILEKTSTVPSWSSVATDRTIVKDDRSLSRGPTLFENESNGQGYTK